MQLVLASCFVCSSWLARNTVRCAVTILIIHPTHALDYLIACILSAKCFFLLLITCAVGILSGYQASLYSGVQAKSLAEASLSYEEGHNFGEHCQFVCKLFLLLKSDAFDFLYSLIILKNNGRTVKYISFGLLDLFEN